MFCCLSLLIIGAVCLAASSQNGDSKPSKASKEVKEEEENLGCGWMLIAALIIVGQIIGLDTEFDS